MEELEQRIKQIEERNFRVESDKDWEKKLDSSNFVNYIYLFNYRFIFKRD